MGELRDSRLPNRARCHRLLETHLNWLDVDRIETGHMIAIMLYDKWQVTQEDGKLPGYKSLEQCHDESRNMARWNTGYHADLSWAIVLPNSTRLGDRARDESDRRWTISWASTSA